MSALSMLFSGGPVIYEGPLSTKLALKVMTGNETLGKLSHFAFDLLSDSTEIDPYELLGKPAATKLEIDLARSRYFKGHITNFGLVGSYKGYLLYRAIVRPWLWFLTRKANCRIFQRTTVKAILETIFGEYGFNFDSSLIKDKAVREFVVQYRETDFNFVSRLMENDGIYYYFKDDADKHQLVLCESLTAHEPFTGYEEIPYYPPDRNRKVSKEHIESWHFTMGIEPGAYATTDYDFKKPADLPANLAAPLEHDMSEGEIFDYPGGYVDAEVGSEYASLRLEQLQSPHSFVEGQTDARGFYVGRTFKLAEFPRTDQNAEYLIASADYEVHAHKLESTLDAKSEEDPFKANFRVHATKTKDDRPRPYRAAPSTPKPIVRGPQTAVVVGKEGEEIHTDEYGRVKVQFRWDREQRPGEDASCFIRVAQAWAGHNFGALFTPRMGDEVIVDFLEGDPDRPIITGSVYHQSNKPPYTLTANQTQSGVKSRSSKGGSASNFNELRFEDKKGSEEVFMQAEKNLTVNVKAAESVTIGATDTIGIGDWQKLTIGTTQDIKVGTAQTQNVGTSQTETIGTDQTLSVGANQTYTIGASETHTVVAARTTSIGAADTLTVGAALATTVMAGETHSVVAGRVTTIGAADALTVVGGYALTAAGQAITVGKSATTIVASESVSVGGSRSLSVSGSEKIEVGAGRQVSVGANDTLEVKSKLGINAGDEAVITVGDATVVFKKSGDIEVKGKKITIKGSSDITIDGSKIVIKGSSITLN